MRLAAKMFLGGLWVVCVYRAATQSIVHDEALTHQLFLSKPAAEMFHTFSANHHFLNTLLMYLCMRLFGLSELSLRLPALAGAALYFAAVYRISRYAFGAGYTFLLSVALLTLHPLILDFMVAARGYGMALGLLMWSLATLLPILEGAEANRKRLVEAGLSLSLSVVANLVFAVPAAVLATIVIWRLRVRALYFVAPVGAAAVLFLAVSPTLSATSRAIYAGAATVQDSLRSLARLSIPREGPTGGEWARDAMALFIAPAVVFLGLATWKFHRSLIVLICSAVAAGSALLLWLLQLGTNFLYPEDRTGIYFLPLIFLALVGLGYSLRQRAAYAVALALIVTFLVHWNTRRFLVWEYDADTREIANRIAARVVDKSPNSVRVGASWALEPSLNFYRERNRWAWMQPVVRAPLAPGFDYYGIIWIDYAAIESLKLKPVYKGPASGTVLAISIAP